MRISAGDAREYTWDDRLTLEFLGKPQVASVTIEPVTAPTIFLAGDSTVTDQAAEPAASTTQVTSTAGAIRRRATARISAIVMSAVSSVSTPGVLVTVMPRWSATPMSMWSTPLPKLAIRRRFGPAWASSEASISSVTVGTSTSASCRACARAPPVSGVSSWLRRASNSSRIRVSTTSGRRRVTTTSGLRFNDMIPPSPPGSSASGLPARHATRRPHPYDRRRSGPAKSPALVRPGRTRYVPLTTSRR